jgi:predicted nucleic-acid-binding Zn-ribbon protein
MMPYKIIDYFSDNSIFPQTATLKIIPVSDNKYIIKYVEQKHYWGIYESENSSDLLTCAYEALCWLAENNYIGGKK